MNNDRWELIEKLYHFALQLSAEDRGAFLDDACAGDRLLREEVESLIKSNQLLSDFLETPAFTTGIKVMADEQSKNLVGLTIGPYRVVDVLGSGGMGEVLLAEDPRLGRNVAIKLLPSSFTSDVERISRFQQEARAASAISHPNVAHIYEIGEIDGRYFTSMEFVDGVTLRELMSQRRLDFTEVIDITLQTASALLAAHSAGVIHRDIKPENIMIRSDGYVKVLDFGLAKLTERQLNHPKPQTAKINVVSTEPGMIVGTPSYMSPEQARGLEVDSRTDVWSLGIVLYEMLTGWTPFRGSTNIDVIAGILREEPTPVVEQLQNIPLRLEKIVTKTLSKDRGERYSSCTELIADLRSLIRDLDIEKLSASPYQSEAGLIVAFRALKGKWKVILLAVVGVITACVALLLYKPTARDQLHRKTLALSQTISLSRITNVGKSTHAAISPDGKYVAYVLKDPAGQSLWIKYTSTLKSVQVAPPANISYGQLAFSPDSNYIFFLRESAMMHENALYAIPLLGGGQRKVTEDLGTVYSVSSDGKRLAFTRLSQNQENIDLMVANIDGTSEQKVATRTGEYWLDCPAWSPDGKVIAFTSGSTPPENGKPRIDIVTVNLEESAEKVIASHRLSDVERLAWIDDGSGLLIVAQGQIWQLSSTDGSVQKITNDFNAYTDLSLTADSSTLCTVQSTSSGGIWLAPKGDFSRAKQITFGGGGFDGISWTPTGKIVYSNSDIWIMDADGSNQKQLTLNSGINIRPSVSIDGSHIVFVSDRTGTFHVWRMGIDGNSPKQITDGQGEGWPQVSFDNKWIIYESLKSWPPTLWKVPVDGGVPVQLLNEYATQPVLDPERKRVAFYTSRGISVMPLEGPQPKKIIDVPFSAFQSFGDFAKRLPFVRWTPDGHHLTYIADQEGLIEKKPVINPTLWRYPLAGGPPIQESPFDGDIWFEWSMDGEQLAYSRFNAMSDVILMKSFKWQ